MLGRPAVLQVYDDRSKDETIDEDEDVHDLQIDIKNNVATIFKQNQGL